ncbi:hypothetical protein GGR56DRAFT_669596 [Xylariaceae sp. FL0804]|nr:hypothetical protein GGR56DRAFT_669596 [Xylariaceae sp. FL0804]
MLSKQLPLLSAILTSAAAHVILETPRPYKFVEYGPPNPISPTGRDFPCKIPPGGRYEIDGDGAPTVMAVGADQTLSFRGWAVHGGGSCQLSVTPGLSPGRDAEWRVIHSIEGGCPARNARGNLAGNDPDRYTFQIPHGVAPGANYTLAWTWVPRIGGYGEFYVTGLH